ncbi:hypothetical protein GBAR_LOCUS17357 [Geodia barretti]|uniref:Uncharacterized protein n=1 Tax=Geodia barretti TaxID=519541 RepID=A0AA35WXY6_GEOBA|nr:hypothetical protein GBAR_LOCUS17357 [Geodia barretti]
MGDFNVNATILFAIMGFQGLLVVTMLVAVLRLSSVVGRLEGRIDGIWEELRNIRQEVAGREQVAGLREQVAGLREQVAENRGLLRALHERVDLVLRHRHDDQSGAVMLTPAEPVPDPAAD